MKEETIAEILKDRWIDYHDQTSWCEVDEEHAYCCIRPEAILHTPVTGMLFPLNGRIYEICMFDLVCPTEGENWLLIYAHPKNEDVEDMTEEEWHDLYGDPESASGNRLDPGVDRGTCHDLRIPGQVATREQ